MVEAATPEGLATATPRTILPGDEETAVKDPVVLHANGRWHLWASCHPLDDPHATDRMRTDYATSEDGATWTWHGTVLAAKPGRWEARGVRITSVLPAGGRRAVAFYDGRASAAETGRSGLASRSGRSARPGMSGSARRAARPPRRRRTGRAACGTSARCSCRPVRSGSTTRRPATAPTSCGPSWSRPGRVLRQGLAALRGRTPILSHRAAQRRSPGSPPEPGWPRPASSACCSRAPSRSPRTGASGGRSGRSRAPARPAPAVPARVP
jgi:hypothetical protein